MASLLQNRLKNPQNFQTGITLDDPPSLNTLLNLKSHWEEIQGWKREWTEIVEKTITELENPWYVLTRELKMNVNELKLTREWGNGWEILEVH